MGKLIIIFLTLLLSGCFFGNEKKSEKPPELGSLNINYYANRSVSSLEVPPDLTKPNAENAFKISKYVTGLEEDVVDFSRKNKTTRRQQIFEKPIGVEVKKSGDRRWLLVDKKPNAVWLLAQNFLKTNGFVIKKRNKKIGMMETDFLENKTEIPDQSLGVIRSLLKKALKTRYALPVVDKYRVRIEPVNGDTQSEVYLSLSSMKEVVINKGQSSENTIWQTHQKDKALETEMLYKLMTYLGSDSAVAREKIIQAQEEKITRVKLVQESNGYAKLVFSSNFYDTWNNVSWALDQMNVGVEDKDLKEGSFYINLTQKKDSSILSRIFGNTTTQTSFQILLQEEDGNTGVYFNDLSEQNLASTIEFSHQFLEQVAQQF
jgi:outer membrane protein assembly factor BamC